MAAIVQRVTGLVIARLLDSTNGFNYWVSQLASGPEYPLLRVFAFNNQQPSQNLFQVGADEAVIDDTSLFPNYPACTVRATVGNNNGLRMTPTIYSGPVSVWVDIYSSVQRTDLGSGTSEQWHDLFLDAMTEAFNRTDEYDNYVSGIGYNNDMVWSRGPIAKGGVAYRQKQRFSMSFSIPMAVQR